MKKSILIVIVSLLLILLSGCFPVFVPVDDGYGRHGGHDHGERHGGHERGGHD